MNNMKDNKVGLTIFILFIIVFFGTIYFAAYKTELSDSGLAYFFYATTAIFLLAATIYGRKNLKGQVGPGLVNKFGGRKFLLILIFFIISTNTIGLLTKRTNDGESFMTGLVIVISIFLGLSVISTRKS